MSRDLAVSEASNIVPLFRAGADPAQNPTLAHVLVGALLRARRLAAGLSQTEAAKGVGFSNPKLSRLERAEIVPKRRDVEDLAVLYKLSPRDEAEIIMLATMAKERTWWARAGVQVPPFMAHLVGLEPAASALWTYELKLVPGLLQTPAYTYALMAGGRRKADAAVVEERLALRRGRQDRYFADLPRSVFLLDEGALHRCMRGPGVMVEQIDHLLRLGEDSRIEIRIVPFSSDPAVAGNIGSLTRLAFAPGTGLPDLIYLENDETGRYFAKGDQPEEKEKDGPSFDHYQTTMIMLLAETASREESVQMLQAARQRLGA
ncbi:MULTISPECIES: helix-turn-helix domain-containing protein [Kitasatospora]|uniref:helix-turn-helix domain-containing protein n=1 Tax=Kitasatospora TaxID=2063 RepID=UPI001EECB9ED|nr:helix-turn-helix transcriptional regulator [Kitasatospora sp. A2-31]MCG6496869.1 helix-turn-helix domain-containing protein [Kitasatospora sp. A2-31]